MRQYLAVCLIILLYLGLSSGPCIASSDQSNNLTQNASTNLAVMLGSDNVSVNSSNISDLPDSSVTPSAAFGESNGIDVNASQESVPLMTEIASLSIYGTNFNDLNANGIRDLGEPGISGVVIHLTLNGAETLDTSTDASGNYSFVGLAPGICIVTEDQLPGRNQTAPEGGVYNITLVDEDAYHLDFGSCEVASGTLAMTYPEESSDDAFGESNGTGVDAPQEPVTVIDETPKLSINGTNFNDLNANGIRDSGEPGISGMVTHLTINGAETFDTSTDESGNYSFVDLVPGMYIVTENCVPGWNQTAPQGGAYNVTLTDKDAYNLDFGNCQIRFASSDLSDSASQDGR